MPDWDDPALLWRAYPKGFLPLPGVGTRGKWRFLHSRELRGGDRSYLFAGSLLFATLYETALDGDWGGNLDEMRNWKRGDFLPDVQITDPATWACCLRDLVEARYADLEESPPDGTHGVLRYHGKSEWILATLCPDGSLSTLVLGDPDPDTDDPAVALVTARAQLHESKEDPTDA